MVATDASPDMLALARAALGPDADLRLLALPGDPLPAADAIVSVGHAISYLPDAAAVERGADGLGRRAAPGRGAAIDIWTWTTGRSGRASRRSPGSRRTGPSSRVSPRRPRTGFVRYITTFVPDGAGAWRRGGEHHENVLVDTSRIPALLAGHGVRARSARRSGTRSSRPACVR